MTIQEDRSFDIFVTDLRRRAEYCDFGAIKDSLIRDQIVVGINDPKLRERLLRETDLTLEKAVKLCRITEQSKEQSKIFISPTTQTGNIDAVKKREPSVDSVKSKNEDSRRIMKCKFCATSHDRVKNGTEERRVRHVEVEEHENNELLEGLYIEEIQGSTRRNIQSDLLVNDIPVSFKLDTGAECNVISLGLANELNAQVQPTSMLLKSFGGHQLDTVGKCLLDTKVKEAKGSTPLEFYVLRDNVRPLLGLESCLDLELITLNNKVEQIGLSVDEVQEKFTLLDEFQDVFKGLGCVEGEYTIKLKVNSHPTIQPQRNVSLRLMDKLKGTLNDLERKDIIAKVEEPVSWVSNLVIVEKANKTLRLCLDPPDLNEAIEKEDFKPPSFETISSTLNGCKVFSVVDMSNCYWHQKLTEESSFLCVFNSPFGRYRFKRMPFGISCASEVAQKMVEKHFGDISGALPIFDDIIIGGRDEQEHDLILRKVLTRARERNIKFNRDKIQFRVNKVKYMGEVVSELGFSPDPDKISSIHNMPSPSCKQDLQRLLGMINYLAKYIPNMSELTAPLRSLLKSDVPWSWFPEHDTALTKLKSVLSSAPVLRF